MYYFCSKCGKLADPIIGGLCESCADEELRARKKRKFSHFWQNILLVFLPIMVIVAKVLSFSAAAEEPQTYTNLYQSDYVYKGLNLIPLKDVTDQSVKPIYALYENNGLVDDFVYMYPIKITETSVGYFYPEFDSANLFLRVYSEVVHHFINEIDDNPRFTGSLSLMDSEPSNSDGLRHLMYKQIGDDVYCEVASKYANITSPGVSQCLAFTNANINDIYYLVLSDKELKQWKTLTDLKTYLDNGTVKDFTGISSSTGSKARFACFGEYEDYWYDEFYNDISNGSYKTKKGYDDKSRVEMTFLYENRADAVAWQKAYNTPKIPVYSSKQISFNYYNGHSKGSDVYIKISKSQHFPSKRDDDNLFSLGYFVMRPANTIVPDYCLISGGSMTGCEPGRTYTYKINLQGFCDLNYNSFYCIQIFEAGNNTPLTSVLYVYSGEDTINENSANNQQIEVFVDSSDGDNTEIELAPDNNGQIGNSENMVQDDFFDSSYVNYSNFDLSHLYTQIEGYSQGISAFFQICWGIFPAEIWALVVANIGLLVILRVLGR